MKIKIILTKGDPITVSEEQAKEILASEQGLIALKDKDGKWNGDVIHRAHIVQMNRDREAEKEDLLKNPRLEDGRQREDNEGFRYIAQKMKENKPIGI